MPWHASGDLVYDTKQGRYAEEKLSKKTPFWPSIWTPSKVEKPMSGT